MRLLVTGGTGFVGAHVVRQLLARGHQVRVTTRPSSPTLTLEGLAVERFTADITKLEDCRAAAEGCDGIFHVAGNFDSSPGGEERMFAIHVTATRALCDAAVDLGIRRLVLCSSSITLPFGPRERPATEDDPDPFPTGSPYHGPLKVYRETKLTSEQLAFRYLDQGLEVVVVNPDFIVGAWDLKPTSGQLILQMARTAWIPFYPPGGKNFIDAEDCGLGHVLAFERGVPGRRYLLGNENLTYREFMAIVAWVLHKPAPVFPLPLLLGQVVGKAGELAQGILPPEIASLGTGLVESMFKERYRSPALARRELGLPATPIVRSVERAWRWFQTHGYVNR